MASSWMPPQRHPAATAERPWMGMAMLGAVPLISLLLIRMLWSGSSLWFLTVGLILLGAAAVVFLARRPQDDYGRQLAPESNRLPLVLTGLGVVFLAMLLLPNFADGGNSSTTADRVAQLQQQVAPAGAEVSDVAGTTTTTTTTTTGDTTDETQASSDLPALRPSDNNPVGPLIDEPPNVSGETYIVVSGDNLWDIATRFDTTVEAIVAANGLSDPADIAIDDELIIPAPGTDEGAAQTVEEVVPADDTGEGAAQ